MLKNIVSSDIIRLNTNTPNSEDSSSYREPEHLKWNSLITVEFLHKNERNKTAIFNKFATGLFYS